MYSGTRTSNKKMGGGEVSEVLFLGYTTLINCSPGSGVFYLWAIFWELIQIWVLHLLQFNELSSNSQNILTYLAYIAVIFHFY